MKYLDPLYGQLEINDKQLQLFQTGALARLRDISLSAIPPLAQPMGMITSRFEHSVGVAFLSQQLAKRLKLKDLKTNLYLAGLFHDAGSPPFSHASEIFLEDLTGKNHEEFVDQVLHQDDMVAAIQNFGGDIDTIYKLITGNLKPYSDLINSTIDLDNIDNSLRWSLGAGLFKSKFYEPEEVIKAYVIKDDQIALDLAYHSEIQKWELCRRLTYDLVYSESNLAPGTMLTRALQLAYDQGELKEDFFKLTDSQALYVLEHRCNPATSQLVSQMRHWQFYTCAGSLTKDNDVSETFKTFCQDWRERQKIADIIADSMGINRDEVSVFAGKDKGFKKIHFPFVGNHHIEEHKPLQKLFWRIKVYVHPKHEDRKYEVQEILESIVNQRLEARD